MISALKGVVAAATRAGEFLQSYTAPRELLTKLKTAVVAQNITEIKTLIIAINNAAGTKINPNVTLFHPEKNSIQPLLSTYCDLPQTKLHKSRQEGSGLNFSG